MGRFTLHPLIVNLLWKEVHSLSKQIQHCLHSVRKDGSFELQYNSGFSFLFSCTLMKRKKDVTFNFLLFLQCHHHCYSVNIMHTTTTTTKKKRSLQDICVYKVAMSAQSTQCITRQRIKPGPCLTHTAVGLHFHWCINKCKNRGDSKKGYNILEKQEDM